MITFADAAYLDRRDRRDAAAWWTASSRGGVVATGDYRATAAGATLLEAGGDAVDAAVAASLALGVCEPHGSGLGGMAMLVAHRAESGRTFLLTGPCRAPALATLERVGPRKRRRGHRAIATPGAPAALGTLHERYGRIDLRDVAAPAIALARVGVTVTPLAARIASRCAGALRRESGGAVFLDDTGAPRPVGAVLRQPSLALTLERIATAGFEDFYRGEIADAIDADMRAHGGYVRRRDLAAMPAPVERAPLRAEVAGRSVRTAAPPGGGLTLVEILRLHAALPAQLRDPDTSAGALALAGCIREARRTRRRQRLTRREDAAQDAQVAPRAAVIAAVGADRARDPDGVPGETTHLVVADRWGNVVSLTQSIDREYGAKVVPAALGFVHNGYLRTFKRQNPRHPHFLRAGAAARSNAAPTIILADGQVWAALGATGSERIASAIAGVVIRLERGTPFAAVHAPRLHCTPAGEAWLEGRASAAVAERLAASGLVLRRWEDYAFEAGGLQLLARSPGGFVGVADPRRDGAAWGVESPGA